MGGKVLVSTQELGPVKSGFPVSECENPFPIILNSPLETMVY